MDKGKKEVPPNLVLTSLLSVSITGVVSITYIILSILGLVYRFNCDVNALATTRGSDHFMNMVIRVYIQSDTECPDSPNWNMLTTADSIFILNILTLCASVLTLITSIGLMTTTLEEDYSANLPVAVYVYVAAWIGSFVVDLTYACHVGMDFTYLSNQMDLSSPGLAFNYDRDMVRLGALLLMCVALKGFVAHALQIVFVCLLLYYIVGPQSQKEEHSIHKMGALNAYDRPRREDPWQQEPRRQESWQQEPRRQESWQQEPPMFPGQNRNTHTNPAFVDDTPTPSLSSRQQSIPDYVHRSESWQPAMSNSRPFSYLEEPKKPIVAPRPASPSEPQWRRGDWAPPVPAPDYSPQTPRRLKSALKPSYM